MIDWTTATSPATLRAISAITVKVVIALNFSSACTLEMARGLKIAYSRVQMAICAKRMLQQAAIAGDVIFSNTRFPCLKDSSFGYPNNISRV